MAGMPIRRIYRARIEEFGIFKILERVESGHTLAAIATSLGMSRSFLSTFLNRDPITAEALCIARAFAAIKRLAARARFGGQLGARKWLENAPALHLAALKAVCQDDRGIAAVKQDTSSVERLTAELRALGINVPAGSSGPAPEP